MSSRMKWLTRSLVLIFIVGAVFAVWAWRLDVEMKERIAHGWFRPPVNLYARGEVLFTGEQLTADDLQKILAEQSYRERQGSEPLYPRDFLRLAPDQIEFRESNGEPSLVKFVNGSIAEILSGDPFADVARVELEPQLFAQFYNGEPILRRIVHIGDVPLECSEAVTAIEDRDFLEHRGVSVTGLLRAAVRDLVKGRYAQGGSTITQQLVKNYFLTPKKTLRRKIQEIVMAILLEGNLNKDQILQNYLNVIYMGQSGPFQVIGFGAASRHYFNARLSDLDLPRCALLAAMINNPKRFDPFTNPVAARDRRTLVLKRMVEYNMISPQDAAGAAATPLPDQSTERLTEPAPYYTQAIFRELDRLHISTENGVNVYTTLDISAQELAQKDVLSHVRGLEQNNKKIAKIKATGKELEASLISVDVETGDVLALVGGRHFARTQYNRVLDAHRQVGSIMKPFVYLAALENRDPSGKVYTATSLVNDEPFVYRYQGQEWAPKDYTRKYHGEVPLFYALKNSLNTATASLGLQIGLTNIVDVARRAGITQSKIEPLPSLTLGAFEIYPWEVATAGLTIARFGSRLPLRFIERATDREGKEIYRDDEQEQREFAPETAAVLVGMMKQTVQTGTARRATLEGFNWPAAGKTGTTSDTRDTWFLGFTPHVLTVTWTGYDDNTPTGLTGASGALPLWLAFMQKYCLRFARGDFAWPAGVETFTYPARDLKRQVPTAEPYETAKNTELIRLK